MAANTSTPNDSNNLEGGDFNMKHRLTGAALLISLGVVILPWLLGSYSISGDGDAADQKTTNKTVQDSASDSAENSIAINDDEEIKVFVSKIKPVDSKGRQIYKAQKSSIQQSASASNDADSKNATQVEKVKEALKSSLDNPKDVEKNKDIKKKASTEVAAKPKENKPEKKKPVATKKDAVTEKVKQNIDQGYIVSVGVYLKKDGAERVISDLKAKGFKPSSSESKSSKGLATRVWLGPFSTRAAAGKERSKLEQVIGEKGWIIRYP